MKRVYLPFLFDGSSSILGADVVKMMPSDGVLTGYYTLEAAEEKAKAMSLLNPKGKVVIFEAVKVVEPRKVEFAVKSFNESGELLV